MGAVCGQAPLTFLVAKFQWHTTLFILAGAGVIITILIYAVVRDKKTHEVLPLEKAENKLFQGLKAVVSSKQTWLVSIHAGLIFATTLVFGTLWGVPFIVLKYHLAKSLAAGIVSSLFIGWIFGAPLFGWLSDRYKRRNIFMLISYKQSDSRKIPSLHVDIQNELLAI